MTVADPAALPPHPAKARRHFWRHLGKDRLFSTLFLAIVFGVFELIEHQLYSTVIDRMKALVDHPTTAVVLAVFPDSSTSRPMLKGLGLGADSDIQLGTPQWILRRIYEGTTAAATAGKIRDELSKNNQNVVLVVGHERSSTAKTLIDQVYEADAYVAHGGPIPLILPAVTNPEITQTPRDGRRHILRLPASDDRQVKDILDLIQGFRPPPKAVELIVDHGNKEYSSYIANALISESNKRNIPIVDAVGVDIFSLGFSPERFLQSKPDTMIFVGMEAEAGIFMRRLKATPQRLDAQHLRVVFTDGVAGDSFVGIAKKLLTDGEAIYITGPPPEVLPGGSTGIPTYEVYSRAARSIVLKILKTAAETGGVSRAEVLKTLQNMLGDSTVTFTEGQSSISFTDSGDNRVGRFHVYEVTKDSCNHWSRCPSHGTVDPSFNEKSAAALTRLNPRIFTRDQRILPF